MDISEIYPSFTLKDPWGRVIRVTANQSLYMVEQKTLVTPGNHYPDPKGISKQQFAMLLLLKVEELAGQGGLYNQDDPDFDPTPAAPDLDAWFGQKSPRRTRKTKR